MNLWAASCTKFFSVTNISLSTKREALILINSNNKKKRSNINCLPFSILTLKMLGDQFDSRVFFREMLTSCFFVFCDYSHYHKLHLSWRFNWNSSTCSEDLKFFSSILTIVINFLDFLRFSCSKETNDICI